MTKDISPAIASTPMMKQYLRIKEEHKDCLLLFRMGDFYELFFDDAVQAAPVLGVILTRRGKADSQEIPMCGIPHHSCNNYIKKLIDHGYKVAICDQLESPQEAKKRGYKAVVKREVVRIITPGTLTDDHLLEDTNSNYLASISTVKDKIAIAYADLSTLEFHTFSVSADDAASCLARINPSELIMPDSLLTNAKFKEVIENYKPISVPFADSFFATHKTEKKLLNNFKLHSSSSLQDLNSSEISACGSLLEYISITQKKENIIISFPRVVLNQDYMLIDRSAQANLELIYPRTEDSYSLLKVIDRTITNHGSRLLKQYLAFPSIKIEKINNRLAIVELLLKNKELRQNISEILSTTPDLERSLSKLAVGRGAPNDLYAIYRSLLSADNLAEKLNSSNNSTISRLLPKLKQGGNSKVLLQDSLIPREIYLNQNDFINHSYNEELANLYSIRDNAKALLENIRAEYRQKTGIPSLKIEFNNVLGYYIEVTKSYLSKITSEEFIHKQTMMNCSRFITEKLKNLEQKILSVNENIASLEMAIFNELSAKILSDHQTLLETAKTIAFLDVMTSFASIAEEKNYTKPILKSDTSFNIKNGRHPVVEFSLSKLGSEEFVPNDCSLNNEQRIWLITGPNMAGKSTFLRQNALIAILSHIGSYVPAEQAEIGIIDRIFSRIGSGDNLAQGQSTFLVEMIETATILNQATNSSLIILDEIGRGTSTYDGMSIAFSCLEHIHNHINARTLFSTHYHEMVDLSKNLRNIACYTVKIKEWENKIIFMHKLAKGIANKSYGINVAELAGIPNEVIKNAKKVLESFGNEPPKKSEAPSQNFSLFDLQSHTKESEILTELEKLNIDEITPKQALDTLYKLKEKAKN